MRTQLGEHQPCHPTSPWAFNTVGFNVVGEEIDYGPKKDKQEERVEESFKED
jgi:hypothetical protein